MAPKSKAKGKGKAKGGGKTLVKKNSEVMCFGPDGQPFKNFNVWCWAAGPVKDDKDRLFVKATVQPGSTEEVLQCVSVPDENGNQETFECPMERVFNCNSPFDEMNTHDIGMIVYQNIPAVLDFMTQRYVKKQIYLTADPLQIAINPFANPGTGGDDYILKIRDEVDPDRLEPHSFTTTRTALDNAWAVMKAQTIIVSGESGAGKTEAVKMAMRYCAAAKSGKLDETVQKAVLGANPVLEAFGNAKTVRNNNSSRFGRYMQLAVERAGGITAGSVQNFLLEKGRVVHQEIEERNYHIFYQMLKCATPEQRTNWHLLGLKDYNYINPHCDTAPGMDDAEEWADCMSAYAYMKMPEEHVDCLYKIMSGCLLLGQIVLEQADIDGADACQLAPGSDKFLKLAAELIGCDPAKIEEGILIKISMAGGAEIRGRWNLTNSKTLLQSLAKALFDETFNWFVKELNKTIEPECGFKNYMGILDIFGFEVFENNSLDQMFINVTNEALQKNFTDVVFDRESALYKAEGVSCGELIFSTNADVINCLTGKNKSLFSILEDQCMAPGANDIKLLAMCYKTLEKEYPEKFVKPKLNGDKMFNVEHTIGPITYNIEGFIEKNMDILRPDLIEVLQTASNPIVFKLYEGVEVIKGKSAKGSLIASQYLTQLDALMTLINTTEPSFIRCIKPNDCKTAFKFVNAKVLIQLFSLSILEALQLKTIGFAYRRPFLDFINQFKFIDLGAAKSNQDDMSKAKAIIATAKLEEKHYGIGKTMVFLKSDGVKNLGRKQREKMAAWVPVVTVLAALQQRESLRKVYNPNAHKKMSRLSALARRKLAGKVAAPEPKALGLGWYRPRETA